MDPKQALTRAAALCSASERCSGDIRKKLLEWELNADEADEVIRILKKEKFIDDERFAGFFVRDRFRFNKWGKQKIRFELKKRGMENEVIAQALDTIEAQEYKQTLLELMKARLRSEKKADPRLRKAALLRFAASRGFEADLCYSVADLLLGDKM
ncbi:MAG: regulatory protein RecX [Breznakibacter sp.]